MSEERRQAIKDCAEECDSWAEHIESLIIRGSYSWIGRPFRRLKAKGEIYAYRNAAAALREWLE